MEDIDERVDGEACAEITKEKLETSYDDDNHYFQKNDKRSLVSLRLKHFPR